MIPAVVTRLKDMVPALQGRVDASAAFAEVMRTGQPTAAQSAYVLPLGFNGGAVTGSTGVFVQGIDEAVGVVLVIRNDRPADADDVDALDDLIRAVRDALAGWTPGETLGVFKAVRGNLVSALRGTIIYQIDFSISDQVRTQ